MLGAEGVAVSQVGSADRTGGVILSGGEQRSVQILTVKEILKLGDKKRFGKLNSVFPEIRTWFLRIIHRPCRDFPSVSLHKRKHELTQD